jgi:hypothetical protein
MALAAAQRLEADRPAEIGFSPGVEVVIRVLHEGKECSEFFRGEFLLFLTLTLHKAPIRSLMTYNCPGWEFVAEYGIQYFSILLHCIVQ